MGRIKLQSTWESWLEAILNTLSGFFISWAVWLLFVAPVFGYEIEFVNSFLITVIFTVSSLIRSYILRRLFNWRSENSLRR